jgi:hypothetical protein
MGKVTSRTLLEHFQGWHDNDPNFRRQEFASSEFDGDAWSPLLTLTCTLTRIGSNDGIFLQWCTRSNNETIEDSMVEFLSFFRFRLVSKFVRAPVALCCVCVCVSVESRILSFVTRRVLLRLPLCVDVSVLDTKIRFILPTSVRQ